MKNKNNSQQTKKDDEVTLTTINHLDTRSETEEENKKSVKAVDVDNQSADISYNHGEVN